MKQRALALALCVLLPCTAFADFQYQQKTQITGGAALNAMKMAGRFSKNARNANEPTNNTVYVKGNRMAHVNPTDTEIVDLDRETVTRLNHNDKTYTVMTFQQMKEEMEKQLAEAKKHANEQAQQQAAQPSDTDLKWDVKVRNTGANKQVAGLETTESILTMTAEATNKKTGEKGNMAMTNDMWMAPEIPGYGEVRDFYMRYAKKMGVMYSDAFSGQKLGLVEASHAKGLFAMADEVSKIKGVPVLQVMRMGSTADGTPLPAASEAPLPQTNGPERPSAGQMAGDAAAGAAEQSASAAMGKKLGGLGGMMGGFGHKKKQQEEQQKQSEAAQNAQAPAVLIESTIELTNFSRAPIGEGVFQVPAGYKQVDWHQQEKEH
jgi:hypothetical protein